MKTHFRHLSVSLKRASGILILSAACTFAQEGPRHYTTLLNFQGQSVRPPGDICQQIAQDIAVLPSTGGIVDLTGYQGVQPQCAPGDLRINKPVELLVGSATLVLNGNLHVSSSSVQITCWNPASGGFQFVDDHSAASHNLFVDGVSNFSISSCTVQQVDVSSRTGVYGLIRVQNSTNVVVLNNQLGLPLGTNRHDGSSSTCMHVINTNGGIVRWNTCDGTYADGFHFTRGSQQFQVKDNQIQYTGDDAISMVALIIPPTNYPAEKNFTISGNHISDGGGPSGSGGLSPNTDGIVCLGCADSVIYDNTIDSMAGPGIQVNAVSGSSPTAATRYPYHVQVYGNSISNTGLQNPLPGIWISNARDIDAYSNSVSSSVTSCVRVSNVAQQIAIDHNVISGCGGRGIEFTQISSTDSRMRQELFTDLGYPDPGRAGISNSRMVSNSVNAPSLESLLLEGEQILHMSSMTVSGNTTAHLSQASVNGSMNFLCDQSTWVNNTIAYAGLTGLRIASSDRVQVLEGSYLSSLRGDGISLISVTNSQIMGLRGRGLVQARQNAAYGVYIDAGGGHNTVIYCDLRNNVLGAILIQDHTSTQFNNLGT